MNCQVWFLFTCLVLAIAMPHFIRMIGDIRTTFLPAFFACSKAAAERMYEQNGLTSLQSSKAKHKKMNSAFHIQESNYFFLLLFACFSLRFV